MIICIKCKKRQGRWWDHVCEYCRGVKKVGYENSNEGLLPDEVVKASINTTSKRNKSAIIGLILSIVSIFGIGLAGLVGMMLGIVALVQIKYTKESGKGLAIAAIIIGFIWSFVKEVLARLVEMGY